MLMLVSAVETGQMSAAETGQMSSVKTRDMYSVLTGLRPVSIVDICLVSTCTPPTLLAVERVGKQHCHPQPRPKNFQPTHQSTVQPFPPLAGNLKIPSRGNSRPLSPKCLIYLFLSLQGISRCPLMAAPNHGIYCMAARWQSSKVARQPSK